MNSAGSVSGKAILALSGANLSGPFIMYVNASGVSGTVGGTADGTALKLALTAPGAAAIPLSLTPDTPSNSPVALSTLAGNWAAEANQNSTQTTVTITLDAAGKISGANPSASNTGALALPDATKNQFLATFIITPSIGATAGIAVTYNGLAYYRPGSPAQLVIMADNGAGVGFCGLFSKLAQ